MKRNVRALALTLGIALAVPAAPARAELQAPGYLAVYGVAIGVGTLAGWIARRVHARRHRADP